VNGKELGCLTKILERQWWQSSMKKTHSVWRDLRRFLGLTQGRWTPRLQSNNHMFFRLPQKTPSRSQEFAIIIIQDKQKTGTQVPICKSEAYFGPGKISSITRCMMACISYDVPEPSSYEKHNIMKNVPTSRIIKRIVGQMTSSIFFSEGNKRRNF
jgi:hypothetical protein